jgi:DNA-binding CsgD family transcriptional regulator
MIQITDLERQILTYLKEGMVQRTISVKLHLSIRELERRISGLKERFGCPNIAALVAFAYENGLLVQMAENRHGEPTGQ